MTLEDLRRGLSDLPQMRGLPLGLWFSWETSGDSVPTLLVISVSKHIFKTASQVMHCSGLLCPAFVAVGHFMTATRPRDGMPRFLKLPATCPALKIPQLYSSLLSSGIHSGMFLNWWMIWIATRSCLCRLPDSWRKKLYATPLRAENGQSCVAESMIVSLLLMQYRYTLEVIPNYSQWSSSMSTNVEQLDAACVLSCVSKEFTADDKDFWTS